MPAKLVVRRSRLEDQDVEYRDIAGFTNYRVGSDGSVWSKRTSNGKSPPGTRWRRLKPVVSGWGGYGRVSLVKAGKTHYRHIHHLVLESFIGTRPQGMVCRHLDGDKHNNRVENLCWGTVQENADDRTVHGTVIRGSHHACSKLTEADIPEIRRRLSCGETLSSVAASYGVDFSLISLIKRHKAWRHVDVSSS